MIRSIRPAPLVAGFLATASAIPAAYADSPPPAGWSGQGQAGLVLARGNSDTTTANTKLDASDTLADWKHTAHLAYLYGQSAGIANAQRLEGSWQSDYNFTKSAFVFGSVAGEQDRYDGFAYQVTFSNGLGYKVIDTDSTKLTGTLGFGYRRLEAETLLHDNPNAPTQVTGRVPLGSSSDGVGTAGLDYQQQLTKTTKVTDKLLVQAGGQNTAVANDLAIAVSMTETLALSVGYGIRYNSNPPGGTKPMDQLTTLNIVYAFNSPTKK